MSYSPPTKRTVYISLICLLIGGVLAIVGFFEYAGEDWSKILIIIGFILCALAWFLMYVGVRLRGV